MSRISLKRFNKKLVKKSSYIRPGVRSLSVEAWTFPQFGPKMGCDCQRCIGFLQSPDPFPLIKTSHVDFDLTRKDYSENKIKGVSV